MPRQAFVATQGVLVNVHEQLLAPRPVTHRFGFTSDGGGWNVSGRWQRCRTDRRRGIRINHFRLEVVMKAETTEPHAGTAPVAHGELPNRLLTAFEVAEFVGCHEETVRRAYLRGLLTSQRFGVRGRRFHPRDVLDWIARGAPTRVS
jgi:excisionase family DNA binding protein